MNRKKQFCCHQTRFLRSKWPTKAFVAGAPPRTPLGDLTALPQTPLAGSRGPSSKGRGKEREREKDGKWRGGDRDALPLQWG